MPITTSGFSHLRLTVTDLARSREFYERVFGWPVVAEVPPDADEQTREQLASLCGGVIYQVGSSILGLRPIAAAGTFDEDHSGLDHLSFAVASHDELENAVRLLDEAGIDHGQIKDTGNSYLLHLRDPDNIALELVAPRG